MTVPERRSTDRNAIRDDILAAINTLDDVNQRVVLTLLLRVVDDIGGKIDRVLQDERRIKDIVLNGHVDVHAQHHHWIEQQMAKTSKVDEAVAFADARHKLGGYCDFAARKLEEEKVSKVRRWKVMDGLAEKVALIAAAFAGGVLFPHLARWFQ